MGALTAASRCLRYGHVVMQGSSVPMYSHWLARLLPAIPHVQFALPVAILHSGNSSAYCFCNILVCVSTVMSKSCSLYAVHAAAAPTPVMDLPDPVGPLTITTRVPLLHIWSICSTPSRCPCHQSECGKPRCLGVGGDNS